MSTDLLLGLAFLFMTVSGLILAAAIAVMLVKKDARKRKGSGALGAAALEVHALLEPERKHVVKAVRAEESESDAQGGSS